MQTLTLPLFLSGVQRCWLEVKGFILVCEAHKEVVI